MVSPPLADSTGGRKDDLSERQDLELGRPFRDLDEAVQRDPFVALPLAGFRPPDLELPDPLRVAQTDLLPPDRRAPEAADAPHGAVDLPDPCRGFHDELDPRSHPGAVAFATDELHVQEMVPVAGVEKHRVAELVSDEEAPELVVDVLVAVVVQIGEGDPVPFLEVPESPRNGHVLEALPPVVAKHHVRHEGPVVRVARAEIDVEETVVVQVSEVRP